ncbi:MAG: hypothetical protein WBM40_06095 [Thiohalocapsa sp.]
MFDERNLGIRIRSLLYVASLFLVCVSSGLSAATRITEGVFDECFYGNRGGYCSFREPSGQQHEIAMPSSEASGATSVTWVIDGNELGYVPVDGGFLIPDHPEFVAHHSKFYGMGDHPHPLKGCAGRLIEKPGKTRFVIDIEDCR